jgi:hypothetical protein
MRLSSIPVLAVLLAGATGCARYSEPRYSQQGYNNPGQWQPLPPPGMAPQPGMGQWTGPQGGPGYTPFTPIFRPVNVPALAALQGRIPCAPKEVAPGTWATFDCAPFQALTRAIQYIPFVRFNFLPTGPLPATVDHRSEGSEGPVKDQGAVGACTALSLSTAMDNAVRRMGRQDVVSALHIWSRYGVGVTGQAGDSNVGKSVTIEQTWAYDPAKACKLARAPMDSCGVAYGVSSGSEAFDPALKAEHVNADGSGRYTLSAVEQLSAHPANPNELAGVLAGGDDIWISFSVNDEAWMSRSLHDGVIPDYSTVGDTGHAVVLAGYRTLPNGTKQFLIHNSWSTRWGQGGYGWISEAMVAQYTRGAYRVRVAEGRGGGVVPGPAGPASGDCPPGQVKAPIIGTCVPAGGLPGVPGMPAPNPAAPAQPPKQAPQGSCPQGQAPDMMTGQCANVCAGGAPAVGGMCLPITAPR